MSIGIPTDGVGDGGFELTRRDRVGDSLTTDKGSGRAEAVLSSVEGTECDTD